ncbi:MAG: TonB-dependent receptor [Aquabacterium sp.]|uniref:TonB-dependent receptor n=1 Tax=Aquabacterium sp. TaxID=1872578 RepID=UPI001B60EBD4|nr:TonB-dependent receptor [Aquabacterium sp.]MBP7131681.1 TonB-dependent receptor [Aquabacterium sp.]
MFSLNSVRVAPGVRSALAVACGLALSVCHVGAQAEDAVAPVVVTATRMADAVQTAPVGASVITAAQIERAGVADANEAIRKLGGVAARSDLNNGREPVLDLRGHGETAGQNLVVLVDGMRVSENELASARLSAIPVAQIERIEIVRGGASVLWGEGASAGVINVILKRPQGTVRAARIAASVESFKGHDLAVDGQWGAGNWVFDAAAKRVRSAGYRDNGGYKQDVGSWGVAWQDGDWRAALRTMHEEQSARLPGYLSLAQFRSDPRQTQTPDDHAGYRERRYLGNVSRQWGDWTLQVDAAQRQREAQAAYLSSSWPSLSASRSEQTQLTPRVSYDARHGGVGVKGMVGLDWQDWDYDLVSSWSDETGKQENQAVFVHGDLSLPTATRITAGWRKERVRKQGDTGMLVYDRKDTLHAGEFGISQALLPGWNVYGRLASSFRLPNVDENRYTPGSAPLLPQRNHDREVGVKWAVDTYGGTLRYFTQKVDHEIAYDNLQYANVNLDPTRRRGVELEGRVQLRRDLQLSATWQQLTARYRSGLNAGNDMVLVSPHTATVRVAWRLDARQTLDVGVQYLASMRPGGDEANTCSRRVPSSTLLDARYAWTDKVWTVALSGTNLTDRQGYNYAYGCNAPSLYPYNGRALKFTVSRQF